ncbi:MAG: hypothetical protein JO262_16450 [Solirubrobacterales bacterium]|nr:hypothetical protein [Solirubrobacterales bacterium]MBV9943720.1 hypothetical protein [Solirubrobacterales bacterium]
MLPELAKVHWRRRVDERSLRRAGRLWTLSTAAHAVPFVAAAAVLGLAAPILIPFALLCLVHAWAIPELYAARGARVAKRAGGERAGSECVALGLLGDLADHRARELHARSGLMLERGRLGVWLVGEAGALLVRPGGRRAHCYCVKATDSRLPPSDRLAHLLLALRTDEVGFATVANLAFSGACWRVRRRMVAAARVALDAAVAQARTR